MPLYTTEVTGKTGLIDSTGRIRDLSAHISDIRGTEIGAPGLAKLAAIDPISLPLVEGDVRYGVPVIEDFRSGKLLRAIIKPAKTECIK